MGAVEHYIIGAEPRIPIGRVPHSKGSKLLIVTGRYPEIFGILLPIQIPGSFVQALAPTDHQNLDCLRATSHQWIVIGKVIGIER